MQDQIAAIIRITFCYKTNKRNDGWMWNRWSKRDIKTKHEDLNSFSLQASCY